MVDFGEYLISFPLNFFFGLCVCIISFAGILLLMRDSSKPTFSYEDSIAFFKDIADLIAIIGVIATIISISPLFLTFIFGQDWFHILLTTQTGIQSLGAIIIATIFAAFFIYCLLGMIVFRWVHKILLNGKVRLSDKIISFSILTGGIISISLLVLFLYTVWFSRFDPFISVTGLSSTSLILGLISFICLGLCIDAKDIIPNYSLKLIFSVIIIIFFLVTIGCVIYPTITESKTIYALASNYTILDKSNFSINLSTASNNNDTPIIIFVRPNFSAYPKDNNVNLEYIDCLWSTNYGYFFTIDSDTLLTERKSDEFVIPHCIGYPNNSVYWTYDLADYSKNKPKITINLQVENSNRKSAYTTLNDVYMKYIIGSAYSNFSLNSSDNLVEE